jgi:hypothetical protein
VLVTHDAVLAGHAQRRIVLQDGRCIIKAELRDEMHDGNGASYCSARGAASRGKFLFVIVAVALGVGCLTGVRGFSQSFKSMLLREARA